MFKKVIALLLLLSLCLCAVSCGKKDEDQTPKGMKLASGDGEPFRLYVPEAFTLNTKSGVSAATLYYTTELVSAHVSAHFSTRDEALTLTDYANLRTAAYAETLNGFTPIGMPDAVLSGVNAKQIDYTAILNGQSMTCREILAFFGEDVVSLHLYAATDRYDNVVADLNAVKDAFVLCDKQVPNDCVTDKKTPDGMKIASADSIEYRLYVPTSWVCHSESGVSEAYVAADKSNVTVTSYSPAASMSIRDYFTFAEKSYKTDLKGYELISDTSCQVAERDAVSYTYRAEYDGVEYRIRQTVLAYNGLIYSITYTAKADCFESHLADADLILSAFRFR